MDEQQIRFYRITAGQAEEYAVPGEGIKILERGCERSEFQFLTHTPLNVALSENSGLEFPDFLCRFQIPLISDAFKRVLDGAGVDNLFYKAILLTDDTIGTQERYWLAAYPLPQPTSQHFCRCWSRIAQGRKNRYQSQQSGKL